MSNKITAFNNIFEGRIIHLIKQIKDLRKKKGNKEKIKHLVKEAKHLRSKLKKLDKKSKTSSSFITINKNNPNVVNKCSSNIHISSVSETETEIIIRFIKEHK